MTGGVTPRQGNWSSAAQLCSGQSLNLSDNSTLASTHIHRLQKSLRGSPSRYQSRPAPVTRDQSPVSLVPVTVLWLMSGGHSPAESQAASETTGQQQVGWHDGVIGCTRLPHGSLAVPQTGGTSEPLYRSERAIEMSRFYVERNRTKPRSLKLVDSSTSGDGHRSHAVDRLIHPPPRSARCCTSGLLVSWQNLSGQSEQLEQHTIHFTIHTRPYGPARYAHACSPGSDSDLRSQAPRANLMSMFHVDPSGQSYVFFFLNSPNRGIVNCHLNLDVDIVYWQAEASC